MSASPNNANLGLGPETNPEREQRSPRPAWAAGGHEALQALLAFSSLHEQMRARRSEATDSFTHDLSQGEQFVLDEVLHLVAERALALTGADGVAVALGEGDAIVCRASAGEMAPDAGIRLDPNSGFSGACFRSGEIIRCDDSETDSRVNTPAAQRLGARSMVAVPLAGQLRTIGVLEAFSRQPFAFDDGDVRSLNLLGELILSAMKPEEEDRMAQVSERVQAETAPPQPHPASIEDLRAGWPQPEPEQTSQANEESEEIPEGPSERQAPGSILFRHEPKLYLLLALLVAIIGGGLWWALRSADATSTSPAKVVAESQQPADRASTTPSSGAPEAAEKADGVTPVTGIRHWSSANSTSVVIDLQDQVQYEAHRLTEPERIYFDLHDTSLAPGLFGRTYEVGDSFVARVRVAQPVAGVTRVVLETKGNPDFSVSLEQNPYRLLVQIHAAGAAAQPKAKVDLFAPTEQEMPAQAASASHPAAPKQLPQTAPAAAKFRIALDAGHGGWDEGTIGRRGLMEKDLALDIVARVGKLIEQRMGAEVVYTRRDDTYIALEKRTEIANLAQADLFVSVHANYSDYPSARGVETYYSNTYSSVNARTPAPGVQDVSWTNVDVREKAIKSRQLAAAVQSSLFGKLATENPGIRDRGIKKAAYVVLTGTTMPAILAEVSFMSSPTDEKSLKSAAYRQRIAEALYRGIARYAAEQKLTIASTSAKPAGM